MGTVLGRSHRNIYHLGTVTLCHVHLISVHALPWYEPYQLDYGQCAPLSLFPSLSRNTILNSERHGAVGIRWYHFCFPLIIGAMDWNILSLPLYRVALNVGLVLITLLQYSGDWCNKISRGTSPVCRRVWMCCLEVVRRFKLSFENFCFGNDRGPISKVLKNEPRLLTMKIQPSDII